VLSLFFASKDDPSLTENGPYKPFSLLHIVLTLLSFALIYILIRYLKHKKLSVRKKWAWGAYAFLVSLNVFRFVWDLGTGQFDFKEDIPLQLCGIQMFTLPVALASRGKAGDYMREFAFSYGTAGFVLAMLLPLTTAYDFPVLHFRNVQSMLYHTAMGFVALMLPLIGYRPEAKNARKADRVLLACALVTGAVNALWGSNYLYTSALPISFELLRWPFYLPFLAAFIFTAGRIPYWTYGYFQDKLYGETDGVRQNLKM
jgi:hypothetical integral membrane protein (TIGR02206 family)